VKPAIVYHATALQRREAICEAGGLHPYRSAVCFGPKHGDSWSHGTAHAWYEVTHRRRPACVLCRLSIDDALELDAALCGLEHDVETCDLRVFELVPLDVLHESETEYDMTDQDTYLQGIFRWFRDANRWRPDGQAPTIQTMLEMHAATGLHTNLDVRALLVQMALGVDPADARRISSTRESLAITCHGAQHAVGGTSGIYTRTPSGTLTWHGREFPFHRHSKL
jgi:hypothetical protein